MKNAEFDRELRRRAQEETFDTSPAADDQVARAIREGRCSMKKQGHARRNSGMRFVPAVVVTAVCLGVVVLWNARPPIDRLQNDPFLEAATAPVTFETILPLASGAAAEPRSALAPSGEANAKLEGGAWRVEARFFNDTQDIWLVSWTVDTAGDVLEPPDTLIWLEPGASCYDCAAWTGDAMAQPSAWRYTSYRVTADVLHWMDGEWLRPGETGYAAQQDLIIDAYENGALVLAPGDWENGMAGEMALVLPDAMGNVSALDTYLAAGLIVEESGGTEGIQIKDGAATPVAHLAPTSVPDKPEGAVSAHSFTPILNTDATVQTTATPVPTVGPPLTPTPVRTPHVTPTATAFVLGVGSP